jgi:hypothetical protein
LANGGEKFEIVRKELSDVLPHLCALEEFFLPGTKAENVLCGWGVEFEPEVIPCEEESG